jgi:two-component system alkaline phosphatase synthesis response regulator PhoP
MDKYKILIVDDDIIVNDMISFLLQERGFDVIKAFDGYDGLIKAQNNQPDLIILDLKMPEMDGFEVCHKLKADDIQKGIPVIILTGNIDGEAHYKAYKYGADDYIIKPFDLSLLITKINKLLNP